MSIDVVNEGTSKKLRLDLTDEDGAPAAPSTLTYRVDCLTTGTAIRATTALSPAASVDIGLTPDDSAIVDDSNRMERRRVTVVAGYAADDDVTAEYDFNVKNLKYYSVP